jgi:hypothetical protein
MPGMTRIIPKGSPLHQKIVAMLSTRIRYAERARNVQVVKWQEAEERALAYLPEQEMDAIRRADRTRGQPRYTTIQIPYTYAMIMAAHTYLTSVFFSRSPVHQFAGRHGEAEDKVGAMEALIGYQIEVGQFLVPYYIWVYDAMKYGVGILATYWEDEVIQFSQITEQVDPITGKSKKLQEAMQVPGYRGNKVFNIAPFDFGWDPRWPPHRFQKGEFCWWRKVMSWAEMIKRRELGYYMNTEHITSKFAPSQVINQGASALIRPEIPGFILDAEDQGHPQAFYMYEVYVEVIQAEWGLGPSTYPEKWVFSVTGDLSMIFGAQPLGAMHGQFPFNLMVPEVEGHGLWPRGTPQIIEPIQQTLDWLINTHFYNVRAALNNQFIIDPSKIVVRDAEDGGPGFIYRLRPEAYGQDITKFFHQVPVTDVTRTHMGDVSQMLDFGEKISGINEQMFGSLAQGGRKTATEVRTSTGFGVNRQKTVAEYLSAMAMSPHAQMLVQQSQQWYEEELKLRIVGDLSQFSPGWTQVTPDSISGFYDFVPVDGTLPIDRMAMANLWQQLMGQLRQIPPLMMQYDIGKIFAYVANLAGIRNVNRFKLQIRPDAAIAQAADMGNIIPMRGGQGTQAPTAPPPGRQMAGTGVDIGAGSEASLGGT